MQKVVYVLISEKPTRIINNQKDAIFYNISGTFIPYYDEVEDELRYTGEIIEQIKEILKKHKDDRVYILMGYDLDENGELMSHILKKEIERLKTKNKSLEIIRTPATEEGFILIKDFVDLSDYIKFKKKDIQFQKKQKKAGIKKPFGLLKAIGLYILFKKRGEEFNINTEGTSTFTFLIKYLSKDKNEISN